MSMELKQQRNALDRCAHCGGPLMADGWACGLEDDMWVSYCLACCDRIIPVKPRWNGVRWVSKWNLPDTLLSGGTKK